MTDGKFRKTFTVQVIPKTLLQAFEEAWQTDVGNKQVTLRYAELAGHQPAGIPTLEGTEVTHEGLNSLTVAVTYAVDVAPVYA